MAIGTLLDLPQKFGTALSLLGGGGGVSERYVFNFNGVNQYIEAPTINLVAGDFAEFKFFGGGILNGDFFCDGLGDRLFCLTQSETIRFNDSVARCFLDGVEIANLSTPYPSDSKFHTIRLLATSSCNIKYIACSNLVAQFYSSIISSFKINDGSVYNFPVDDGPDSTTIRNTGTGPDATPINFLNSGWEKVPV